MQLFFSKNFCGVLWSPLHLCYNELTMCLICAALHLMCKQDGTSCGYWAYVPCVVSYTFRTIILKCHKWYFVSNRTFNSCYYKFCLTISEMWSTYKQVLSWNTTPLSQSYNRNFSGGCIKVRSVVGVNVVVGLQNE